MKRTKARILRKRALSMLLALTMLFSSADLTAFATEGSLPLETDTAVEAEETENSEDTDASPEYDDEDDSGESEEAGGTGETNTSDEADNLEETGTSDGEDDLEETGSSERTEGSDEVDNSDETDEAGEAGTSDEEATTEESDDSENTDDIETDEEVDFDEEMEAVDDTESDEVDISENSEIESSNLTIKSTNSFGRLFANTLNSQQAEELENSGCDVFSITMNGTNAVVTFQTIANATLVVGVYEDDGVKQLATGSIEVSAGDKEAVVDIEIESLPVYFYLRGYLVETASLRPISTVFESTDYTEAMQDFYATTTDDFDSEHVLNLDEDKTNNYLVFDDSVKLIPRSDDESVNEVIECDEDNLVYIIQNPDSYITELKQGDIFAYYYANGEALFVSVEDIKIAEEDGSKTATIYGGDMDLDDMFEFIKIGARNPRESTPQTYARISVDEHTFPTWEKTFDNSNDEDDDDTLSYGLNLKISPSLTICKTGRTLLSAKWAEVKLGYDAEVSASISKDFVDQHVQLGNITIPTEIGVVFEVNLKLHIKVEGKIELKGTLSGSIGARVDSDGITNRSVSPTFEATAEISVDVYIGLEIIPSVNFLDDDIVGINLTFEGGANLEATLKLLDVSVNKQETERHGCEKCVDGDVYLYLSIKGGATFLGDSIGKGITLVDPDKAKKKIGDFYYSIDHKEFDWWKECPYKEYKITIVVESDVNSSKPNIPLEGVEISVRNMREVTDKDGMLTMWIPGGSVGFNMLYKGQRKYESALIDGSKKITFRIHVEDDKTVDPNPDPNPTPDPDPNPNPNPDPDPDPNPDPDPDPVEGKKVRDVFSDGNTIGAITVDGSLYMWGYNKYGQVGNGAVEDQQTPVKVLDNVKEAYIDGYTSAAITTDGALYMWGYNRCGQVGNGDGGLDNNRESVCQLTPTRVLDNVKEVTIDNYTSAAITTDGALYMWGYNYDGLIGNGEKDIDQYTPVQILKDDKVEKVLLKNGAAAAITADGDLYMWGCNDWSMIGYGGTGGYRTTPSRVLEDVREVAIGYYYSAAVKTNGDLYMWGYNYYGQIGTGGGGFSSSVGNYDYRSTPEKVLLEDVKKVELQGCSSAAITADGSLYLWGKNIAHSGYVSRPEKILDDVDDMVFVPGFGESIDCAAAVTADKSLYMWGDCYQIGIREDTGWYESTPVKILDNVDETCVESIIPLSRYNSAITLDGSWYIWGSGVLLPPTKAANNVTKFVNIFSIMAFITTDGSLYMAERNNDFQGGGETDSDFLIIEKVQFPIDSESEGVSEYAKASEPTEGSEPIEPYVIDPTTTSLYSVHDADTVSDNKAVFSNLTPNDIYNIYVMKSKDAEEPLGSDNLLYIAQAVSDVSGNLSVDFGMTQAYENPAVFCVSFTQTDLSSAEVTVPDITYDGDAHYPEATVSLNGQQLVEGTDYEIYGDCSVTDIGEYEILIKGIGTYCGGKEVTFRVIEGSSDDNPGESDNPGGDDNPEEDTERDDVLPEDIPENGEIPEGLWIAGVSEDGYAYTGSAIKPEVRVYDHKILLAEKTDYTITYKNNTKANDATVAGKAPTITVTGKGNYTGRETQTFKILPLDISPVDISSGDADTLDEFEADDISVVYNGKAQKPVPVLYWNGKKLTNKTDYTFTYHEGMYAGTDTATLASVKEARSYYIKLTGKGNFTGTRRVKLTVLPKAADASSVKPISMATVTKIPNQSYLTLGKAGAATPDVTVKYGSETLTPGTHYTVTYSNNTKVGTAYAIIKGNEKNGYSGTKRVSFKITGMAIKKATVKGLSGQTFTYSGVDIEPTLTLSVKLNGMDVNLVKGTDYSVTWQKNRSKGTATVIFTGKNGYTGTLKKKFKIKAFNIAENKDSLFNVKLESDTVPYAKGGAKPELTVTFLRNDGTSQPLKEGTDYTVSYKNNKAVNDGTNPAKLPTLTIKGKGNFTGTYSQKPTYKITAQELGKLKLTAADKVYQNKKNIYSTKVTITDLNGKPLKAGTDYDKKLTYTYQNATTLDNGTIRKAGDVVDKNDIIPTGTVICVSAASKGNNYTGTLSGEYSFKAFNISGAKVTIPRQTYTGRKITLDKTDEKQILVKVKGKKVEPDQFDIVDYTNNVKKGTATVTLRGKDNYGGTKTVKFTIGAKGFLWWWRN